MENPLANPLHALEDSRGRGPHVIWKGVGAIAGIIGAIVARKLIDAARSKVSSRGDVPLNPGDERMTWPNALGWATAVGVGASLGRVLAQRIVAAVWTRRTNRPVSTMPS